MHKPNVSGFTIDGASSLDLDDALYVQQNGDHVVVQVHIADVAGVIPQDSFLEQKARAKVETLYRANGNISPMFPASVEETLSLLPDQQRAVVTLNLLFDCNYELVNRTFAYNHFISQTKYSYEAADVLLRGTESHPLKLLEVVAKQLNQKRQQAGAIFGQLIDGKYIGDEGQIIDKPWRSQQIIAEFMILANAQIADFLSGQKVPAIYRNHAYRDLEQLPSDRQHFLQTLATLGDETRWQREMEGHFDRATYGVQATGHVGLKLDAYCHATSPIRRFGDVINQRILAAIVQGFPSPYAVEELEAIASHINEWRAARLQIKKQWFAASTQEECKAVLAGETETDLTQLAANKFSPLLSSAAKLNKITAQLHAEAIRRAKAAELLPLDFYRLLLELANEARFQPLKLELLAIIEHGSLPISILAIAEQKHKQWSDVEYRVLPSLKEGFVGLAVVTQEDLTLSPPQWSVAGKKADVKSIAAYQWLESYVYGDLVSPEMAETEMPVIKPEARLPQPVVEDSDNYVALLNNYAQQASLNIPTYGYKEVRQGYFLCSCEFDGLKGRGEAGAKKLAKQKAAEQVWLMLTASSAVC